MGDGVEIIDGGYFSIGSYFQGLALIGYQENVILFGLKVKYG